MLIGIIIGIFVGGAAAAMVYFMFFKKGAEGDELREKNFENFASQLFEEKIKSWTEIASMSFKEREEKVHKVFEQMQRELRENREYVNTIEKERVKAFSELTHGMASQAELIERLRTSTEKLNNVLSNSRLRGQFGEKIAEDILRAGGLIEGTHYTKNKMQETVSTRPDFTFLLPDGHKINMDVKFPLENFAKMLEIEDRESHTNGEAETYKRAFLRDIKEKLKEVTSRDYINPKENTLDFVILFIPNEGIASYIHEQFPEIFDLAVTGRVTLSSPYTLISFVSMIQRSFHNFYQRENIRDILLLIGEFSNRYDLFKERFEKIGKKIDDSRDAYEAVAKTSFNRLDSTIKQIEKHQKGEIGKIDKKKELE